MAQAAREYLKILETVSSHMIILKQELRGPFKTITPKELPQGLKNNVQDPTEMIQQLETFCIDLLQQVKIQEANYSKITQAWEAEAGKRLQLATEKEALLAKQKNSEVKIDVY